MDQERPVVSIAWEAWAESCSALQSYLSSRQWEAVSLLLSPREGTAPSCQVFARSEAAAEPDFTECSRGCSELSISPWEAISFPVSQWGSFGFRSQVHMKHFPGGILIGSIQEIHFCFCEMSQ